MAAYNTEAYIPSAVESILTQDYTDFEFIIVDDGSTDTTGDVLAQYAAQDQRIVLVRQPENQGLTRALNLGLSRARGRLVARQDADDISLVMLDVVMPEMGGRDLADRVGMMRPGVKILFMSGYSTDAVEQQGVLAHGSAFLEKPFSPDSLLRKVRDMLEMEPAEHEHQA